MRARVPAAASRNCRRRWPRASRCGPSSPTRPCATSTSSPSRCRSSGTTPTSSRCCGSPASRLRSEARTRHDPLVVIGGAVTFVNPEPLAPVRRRDRRGRRGSAGSVADDRDPRRRRSRRLAASARRRARLLHSVVLRRATTTADGTIAAFVPKPGTGAPPVVKKAAVKSTERIDPPSTRIFTPDTEFGSRFLIEVVRGCANLCRFCWAGYNYLPVRAFPADRILELAREARARQPRRPRLDRAVRSSGDRAHPVGPAGSRATRSPRPRCASTISPRRSSACCTRAASARSPSRPRPDPIACAA